MSEDGPDPFDATLRASLERLRATPARPAVEERLGLVERLGCRRRQRRALARGGAVAVVVAILAVSVVSALGRVEGASDRSVQVWGRPPTGRGEPGPGTSLVAGEQPEEETTTTVTTTTIGSAGTPDPTTVPGGPTGGAGGPSSTAAGIRPPGLSPSTAILAVTTTVTTPQPLPTGCEERDATGGATVGIYLPDPKLLARIPQCHRVSRGTTLRLQMASGFWDSMTYCELRRGDPSTPRFARFDREVTTVGPVDDLLPAGRWVQFDLGIYLEPTGMTTGYGAVYLMAV
jgi:hypothetical protein